MFLQHTLRLLTCVVMAGMVSGGVSKPPQLQKFKFDALATVTCERMYLDYCIATITQCPKEPHHEGKFFLIDKKLAQDADPKRLGKICIKQTSGEPLDRDDLAVLNMLDAKDHKVTGVQSAESYERTLPRPPNSTEEFKNSPSLEKKTTHPENKKPPLNILEKKVQPSERPGYIVLAKVLPHTLDNKNNSKSVVTLVTHVLISPQGEEKNAPLKSGNNLIVTTDGTANHYIQYAGKESAALKHQRFRTLVPKRLELVVAQDAKTVLNFEKISSANFHKRRFKQSHGYHDFTKIHPHHQQVADDLLAGKPQKWDTYKKSVEKSLDT